MEISSVAYLQQDHSVEPSQKTNWFRVEINKSRGQARDPCQWPTVLFKAFKKRTPTLTSILTKIPQAKYQTHIVANTCCIIFHLDKNINEEIINSNNYILPPSSISILCCPTFYFLGWISDELSPTSYWNMPTLFSLIFRSYFSLHSKGMPCFSGLPPYSSAIASLYRNIDLTVNLVFHT